jgi:hypothetical protein
MAHLQDPDIQMTASSKNMENSVVPPNPRLGNAERETLCAELLWIEKDMNEKRKRKKEIETVLIGILENDKKKALSFRNPEMEKRFQIDSCNFVLRQYNRTVPLKKEEERKLLAEFLLSTSPRQDNIEEQKRASDMACAALAFLAERRTKKTTQSIEKRFLNSSTGGTGNKRKTRT